MGAQGGAGLGVRPVGSVAIGAAGTPGGAGFLRRAPPRRRRGSVWPRLRPPPRPRPEERWGARLPRPRVSAPAARTH